MPRVARLWCIRAQSVDIPCVLLLDRHEVERADSGVSLDPVEPLFDAVHHDLGAIGCHHKTSTSAPRTVTSSASSYRERQPTHPPHRPSVWRQSFQSAWLPARSCHLRGGAVRGVRTLGCTRGEVPQAWSRAVLGIDLSVTMVAEARRRHGGHVPGLRFDVGDVFALAFDDASFDRVLASQVLLHVPGVEAALTEIARVLDPRGQLSLTEIDWGSISVECSDRELARRFTALACDGLRNGMIVRDLPTMLRNVGLSDVDIQPELTVSWEPDAFHTWFVEPSVRHFVHVGTFTEDEGERFLGDLRAGPDPAGTLSSGVARRWHQTSRSSGDRRERT